MQQTTPVVKRSKLKRWYNFNKQKLPMYLSAIAVIFFTGFLDFTLKDRNNVVLLSLESHFKTNNGMAAANGGIAMFMIFILNLLAIIQMFNTVTFSVKRSPFIVYLVNGITVLQVAAYVTYMLKLFQEYTERPTFNIFGRPEAIFSMAVFTLGIIFQLGSTVLTWFYVDWKYVKIED